jgi:hypothetical protein
MHQIVFEDKTMSKMSTEVQSVNIEEKIRLKVDG